MLISYRKSLTILGLTAILLVVMVTDAARSKLLFALAAVGIYATYGTVLGIPLLVDRYGAPAFLAVLVALTAIIVGIRRFRTWAGKGLLAAGLLLWLFLGAYGLGHGG